MSSLRAGPYVLEEPLDMQRDIWRAIGPEGDGPVALKLISTIMTDQPDVQASFMHEAAMHGELLDFGFTEDQQPYIVTDLRNLGRLDQITRQVLVMDDEALPDALDVAARREAAGPSENPAGPFRSTATAFGGELGGDQPDLQLAYDPRAEKRQAAAEAAAATAAAQQSFAPPTPERRQSPSQPPADRRPADRRPDRRPADRRPEEGPAIRRAARSGQGTPLQIAAELFGVPVRTFAIAVGVLVAGAIAVAVATSEPAPPQPDAGVDAALTALFRPLLEADAEPDDAAPPRRTPPTATHVTLVLAGGTGRFVRLDRKRTLCWRKQICKVPITARVRIERRGFHPLILDAETLSDHAGEEWVVEMKSRH